MIRRDIIVTAMLTFCLTTLLFMVVPTRSQSSGEYDPWCDLNNDGKIDILDVVMVTNKYATTGAPINETQLLLNLNATVHDLEMRTPKKGYISVSPAEFGPQSNTQAYVKSDHYLRGENYFCAGLTLPNGATLTNMTVRLVDNLNTGRVSVVLWGYNITSNLYLGEPMAYVATSDEATPNDVVLSTSIIVSPLVDTKNCVYALVAWFTENNNNLYIKGIVLEYEYLP